MDVSYFSLVAFLLFTPITATPVIQDTEYAVLIGGYNGNYLLNVEAWFPGETSPCTAPPKFPPIPQAAEKLSAAVLGNMIIYCGGIGGNQCYSYTVGSSRVSWDPAPSMIHARGYFTLTNINNVLIATGGYDDSVTLSSVEVYKDGRWSEVEDWELTRARDSHCAVKYGDSKLVLTGGYILTLVEQLDTITGEWTQMPKMNEARYGHSCVSFKNDIIVAGGSYGNSAERFSSATGNWEVLPRLDTARQFPSMGVLNGYPTVMGGSGPASTDDVRYELASTEIWNGTQWLYGKQLQNRRENHGAVVLTCD